MEKYHTISLLLRKYVKGSIWIGIKKLFNKCKIFCGKHFKKTKNKSLNFIYRGNYLPDFKVKLKKDLVAKAINISIKKISLTETSKFTSNVGEKEYILDPFRWLVVLKSSQEFKVEPLNYEFWLSKLLLYSITIK